jgi:hypothetical protein
MNRFSSFGEQKEERERWKARESVGGCFVK